MDLVDSISRINLAAQAIAHTADALLRQQCDLSFNEFLLLRGVGSGDLQSQGDLKGVTGIGEAGISRIVSRLVGRGLLKTATDPRNRRKSMLQLTGDGERLLSQAAAALEASFAKITEEVSSERDLAAFEMVLDAYLARLGF
ncbi:MAG: winged helix-turn-helix transcriptional regulator [Hyphomicrobiaceae bacterium]|nr:winged helix-turn-helix transcriptional regulator [Hyphomicrobiaceae bacterium]